MSLVLNINNLDQLSNPEDEIRKLFDDNPTGTLCDTGVT